MSGSNEHSGERALPRRPMTTRERFDPSRRCRDLLADVPWDGVVADAETMSAREFLGTLLG